VFRDLDLLAQMIHEEHGKVVPEAKAEIMKGLETLEYAEAGLCLLTGSKIKVSGGVYCEDYFEPLGVVMSICPFNFPFMVPFWTWPIALVTGNCMICKPSEKVPKTMTHVHKLSQEAGFPPGVFEIVHGTSDVVNKLIASPTIKAVTFVGSSPVGKIIADLAHKHGKKSVCLGGAKNHLLVLPDADMELTTQDVVNSVCGSSGQRCLAASVVVMVGSVDIKDRLVEIASKTEIAPVIDQDAHDRLNGYMERARNDPECEVLLDGSGETLKPSVIIAKNKKSWVMTTELFGPIMTVIHCKTLDEAIELENSSEFGNGASVYTQSGAKADYVTRKLDAGMVAVNIGVPVPREPFSFGGHKLSNLSGYHDITGEDGIRFFTRKKKITTRWGKDEHIF
jgi:acyl-CoA reductase-like NAD-dependent aldehyde dehydrogenase